MTYRTTKLSTIAGFLLLINSSVVSSARDMCEDLQTSLREAESGFAKLRGNFDFTLGEYQSDFVIGRFDTCTIDTDGSVSSLSCSKELEDDESANVAEALMKSAIASVLKCFGSNVRQGYSRPGWLYFRHLPTDDSIVVRVRRRVSDKAGRVFHYVTVEVTNVDPTKP